MTQHILTPEKMVELKQELETLTTKTRQKIAEDLEYAKSLGDLSENAEYHDARTYQAEIEARIRTIEHILKHALVVEKTNKGDVEIGSIVTLKKKGDKKETVYTIVGSEESDITKGRISYDSPIGSALMGKKKNEFITIVVPAGDIVYTIIDIQ